MSNPSRIDKIWIDLASRLEQTKPQEVRSYFSNLINTDRPPAELGLAAGETLYDHILGTTGGSRVGDMPKQFKSALIQHIHQHYSDNLPEFEMMKAMTQLVKSKYEYWERQKEKLDECCYKVVSEVYDFLRSELSLEILEFKDFPHNAQAWLQQKLRGYMYLGKEAHPGSAAVSDCFSRAFRSIGEERKEVPTQPFIHQGLSQEFNNFKNWIMVIEVVLEVYDFLRNELQLEILEFDDFPYYIQAWLQQKLRGCVSLGKGTQPGSAAVSDCFSLAFRSIGKERKEVPNQLDIHQGLSQELNDFKSWMMAIGGGVFN